MRWLLLCAALLPPLVSGPAFAQDKAQTLADLQTELGRLSADFNGLKAELVQSGAASSGAAGGDALQRMDAIEAALTRITAKTEEIELKVNRVVSDGTNRIGDIEFRLCEQTEGCDPANIPETPVLGGGSAAPAAANDPAPAATATAPATDAPELAMGEKNDFDRAKGVLGQGDFRAAADLFATFTQSYPGSPLSEEANFNRGEALSKLDDTANAARAYLEAFSGKPDGPFAAESLLKLGQALGTLGQTPDACVTLAEVGNRFPGSIHATNAQVSMQGLGCQ
ncbi:tol-pal system protein YbgF [Cypionkella aquatica]|uniref:Cell division coordinator CpoB n=1 Tax=Cypionkella aquatica TaxID=1756042 RepID=A0AA37X1Y0_9RHOB|nr:tol-pal system protein YbgF [Cypionkella aquatica]GLS85626.1 tol-pal system protein YbgF [Cypionkella aquatica]